jgi:hypothetical protein
MHDPDDSPGAIKIPAHFFLSYRRRAERDAGLAEFLRERLAAAGHKVFIDVDMPLGTRWSEEINRQIDRADFLVVILSKETVESEMVLAEVRLAHQRQTQEGRPLILPVRVDYTSPLGYELGAYLDPLQYELWRTPADNARISTAILKAAIRKEQPEAKQESAAPSFERATEAASHPQPSVDRRAFVNPSGSMLPNDPFYVTRAADKIIDRLAGERGTTLVIKAPRQIGKSSLLVRYMKASMAAGKRLAFIDLQGLAEAQLADYPSFLACFAKILLQRLRLPSGDLPPLESGFDVTNLVESRIFPEIEEPILLALDEADRLLGRPWQTDFFGMLRIWHNNRWQPGWSDVDLALVIATEPYLLVASEHQSPFNVGEVANLPPFDLPAVQKLNHHYGEPLRRSECEQLYQLLHGHPYLTRVALHRLITTEGLLWSRLVETADDDDGPFADHLKALLMRLDRAGLAEVMHQVIRRGQLPGNDWKVFYRLKGAGLVLEETDCFVPANLLYARFFGRVLKGAS